MKTTEVKPGDTILEKRAYEVYLIVDITPSIFSLGKITRFLTDDKYLLFLSDDELEIIEPSDTIAKPGDTIIVTDSLLKPDFGKKYVVVEPEYSSKPVNDVVDRVWVKIDNAINTYPLSFRKGFFYHRSYEIIKRTNNPTLVSCPDCNGTGEIQLFTSVAKCRCCEHD